MLNFCDFIQVYVFTTNRHLRLALVMHVTRYTNCDLEAACPWHVSRMLFKA